MPLSDFTKDNDEQVAYLKIAQRNTVETPEGVELGTIFDPQDGKTYNGDRMTVLDADKARVLFLNGRRACWSDNGRTPSAGDESRSEDCANCEMATAKKCKRQYKIKARAGDGKTVVLTATGFALQDAGKLAKKAAEAIATNEAVCFTADTLVPEKDVKKNPTYAFLDVMTVSADEDLPF